MEVEAMKKTLFLLVLLCLMIPFAFSGGQQAEESGARAQFSTPPLKDEWVESLRIGQTLTSPEYSMVDSTYSYDDMSKHYTISWASFAWFPQPMPENDPVQEFYEKYLNVTVQGIWASGTDLVNKITTSFAAGEPIDFFYLGDRNLARKLVDEGLVLADWTPYMKYMPTIDQYMTREDRLLRTINGKMYGVNPTPGRGYQIWQTWIRKDWLDNLGMAPPKTTEELFEVAQAFTFGDPDGNGKNDTYALTSAGEGKSFGWVDGVLNDCFGVPTLAIEGGKVIPNAINPKRRDALAWFKRMIDAGLVDPNWYTQDGTKALDISGKHPSTDPRRAQIGITAMWLPGSPFTWLYEQTPDKARIPSREVTDWIIPPLDTYRQPFGIQQASWMVSANAAKDEGKLLRIAHLLDYVTCPNEGYWLVSRPMLVAGGKLEKTEAGVVQNRTAIDDNTDIRMLWNWSAGFAHDVNHTNWGLLEWYMSPPTTPTEVKQTFEQIWSLKDIPTREEYSYLVSADASIAADLKKYVDINEYAFVTGQRSISEWDAYVNEYLTKVGGNKLIADYETQLRALNVLK